MTVNQIQLSYKTYTAAIYNHTAKLTSGDSHRAPVVSGEGHTVPERVGPHGVDNAANQVLVCLPCAQVARPPGRRPLPKKNPLTSRLTDRGKTWRTAIIPSLDPNNILLPNNERVYVKKRTDRRKVSPPRTHFPLKFLHDDVLSQKATFMDGQKKVSA